MLVMLAAHYCQQLPPSRSLKIAQQYDMPPLTADFGPLALEYRQRISPAYRNTTQSPRHFRRVDYAIYVGGEWLHKLTRHVDINTGILRITLIYINYVVFVGRHTHFRRQRHDRECHAALSASAANALELTLPPLHARDLRCRTIMDDMMAIYRAAPLMP